MQKIDIIHDLTKSKCTLQSLNISSLSFCERLKESTQQQIGCYITTILQKHALETKHSLIEASKSLQKDFILRELSNFEDSEQGMTYRVATKENRKSFAVIKFAFNISPIEQDNILHEIAIGLLLNSVRQYTPNFMYTYGGFICSPPIDRHRIALTNELQNEISNIFELPRHLHMLYIQLIGDREEEPQGSEDKTIFLDYLPTLVNIRTSYMRRLRQEPSLRLLRKYKEELAEILDEAQQFSSETFKKDKQADKQELTKCLYEVDSMLEVIYKREDRIKELMLKLDSAQSIDTSVCSSDDKAVILLTEFFSDSQTFFEFSGSEPSMDDASNVVFQIVLSMIIAHKKLGYVHSDLHVENVLVQENLEDCKLTYILGSKTIEIQSNYIARIIDFGFSSANYKGSTITPHFSDRYFQDIYNNKIGKNDLMWFRGTVEDYDYYNKFTKNLLALESYDEMEEYILKHF
jgi:hypothetical protein